MKTSPWIRVTSLLLCLTAAACKEEPVEPECPDAGDCTLEETSDAGPTPTDAFPFQWTPIPASSLATFVGEPSKVRLEPSFGTKPYRVRATSPLPQGLTLFTDGIIEGTLQQEGRYPIEVEATDSASPPATARGTYDLIFHRRAYVEGPVPFPDAREGEPYRAQISVTGCFERCEFWDGTSSGKVPYAPFPSGLTLSEDGVISGTPAPGSARHYESLVFNVRDEADYIGNFAGKMDILPPAPADLTFRFRSHDLPNARVGDAYEGQLYYEGAQGAVRFRVTSGALPAGLTLDADTGLVSGTPTQAGDFRFTLGATDAADHSVSLQIDQTVH